MDNINKILNEEFHKEFDTNPSSDEIWIKVKNIKLHSMITGMCILDCDDEIKYRRIPPNLMRRLQDNDKNENTQELIEEIIKGIRENPDAYYPKPYWTCTISSPFVNEYTAQSLKWIWNRMLDKYELDNNGLPLVRKGSSSNKIDEKPIEGKMLDVIFPGDIDECDNVLKITALIKTDDKTDALAYMQEYWQEHADVINKFRNIFEPIYNGTTIENGRYRTEITESDQMDIEDKLESNENDIRDFVENVMFVINKPLKSIFGQLFPDIFDV